LAISKKSQTLSEAKAALTLSKGTHATCRHRLDAGDCATSRKPNLVYTSAQVVGFAGDGGLPFGWMLDMWIGCILATLVASRLYEE
jgi:hypothetical protein